MQIGSEETHSFIVAQFLVQTLDFANKGNSRMKVVLFFLMATAGLYAQTGTASTATPPGIVCPAGYICTPNFTTMPNPAPPAGCPQFYTCTPTVSAMPTVSAPPAPSCPSFYATGASFNRQSKPEISGWVAIATLLPGTKCGTSSMMYSITLHTENLLKTGTIQDTTTTGFAFPFKAFGKINVFLCGTAGVATTAGTAQSAFSGCAVATIPLGKSLMLTPWVNAQKGITSTFGISVASPTVSYGLGLGRSW